MFFAFNVNAIKREYNSMPSLMIIYGFRNTISLFANLYSNNKSSDN